MFTVTLFVERPLDFSAFPTVLLASLMLRLSLNVSSTKLIIGQGHTGTAAAGDVIEGFAMFVMGGSVFLGLVVFCVLLIVNFVVITKGAGRMAEVGARFALDAMPGKQMAIDADVSSGAIDHATARLRRETEQAETTFFGSLDGASKFVKGDAVAGLLITLLNLVVGLVMGIVVHGMPMGRAFETYAILTVGDGLVSQIPAVIISIAAALLLSRGGATGAADLAIVGQLGKHPAALGTVAVLMALFALVPGLPFVPFVVGALVLGGCAFVAARPKPEPLPAVVEEGPKRPGMGDVLDLDDIHLQFAPDLVEMVLDPSTGLDARIANMRDHVASTHGLILPEIRLTDDHSLPPGTYVIRIQDVERARDRLRPEAMLALMGPDAALDAARRGGARAGLRRARALDRQGRGRGRGARRRHRGGPRRGAGDASAGGRQGQLRAPADAALAAAPARRLRGRLRPRPRGGQPPAARRADPRQGAARPAAAGAAAALGGARLDPQPAGDPRDHRRGAPAHAPSRAGVRARPPAPRLPARLRAQAPDGTIPLVQLAPEWEGVFQAHEVEGHDVALPPDLFQKLTGSVADRVARAAEQGAYPAIVTSSRRRRFLRMVLAARGVPNPVLSFEEIGIEARPAVVGLVPA